MTVTSTADETPGTDLSPYLPLMVQLRNGARPQPDSSTSVDGAVHVWAQSGLDTLLAAPGLRFEPFDYLSELRMRGLAN
ncbi:MAG: hypothetical protein AB7G47_02970 [Mycolicibacterium sp.]|uniref:hypothetical protein n=1 Tax=Mycolicibacterium sp. TaxID=2320850 RepID=UPI003D0B0D3C